MADSNDSWSCDALSREDIDAIKAKALADPAYVEERDEYGSTPLLVAIADGCAELVEFLLTKAADPNIEVDDGYTCLLTAVESEAADSVAIVRLLVAGGAEVDALGIHGWTALHMAASRGQVEKTRTLIEAGADVNRRKEIDASETPLMEAAHSGQAATTRLLLEHGADPTMRETMQNRTPIRIAQDAMQGPDQAVVDFLREQDFKVDLDEIFDGVDIPQEQLEQMKQMIGNVDMVQNYIDGSQDLADHGNHKEVIRILEAYE